MATEHIRKTKLWSQSPRRQIEAATVSRVQEHEARIVAPLKLTGNKLFAVMQLFAFGYSWRLRIMLPHMMWALATSH
ncbi:hypothetical protein JHK87_025864 [Glycine soja]|nr:hypothetical protein JHK87_025864 [Glycine soja]